MEYSGPINKIWRAVAGKKADQCRLKELCPGDHFFIEGTDDEMVIVSPARLEENGRWGCQAVTAREWESGTVIDGEPLHEEDKLLLEQAKAMFPNFNGTWIKTGGRLVPVN